MSNVPDINVIRELAEEKTAEFNGEFAKSEVFAKMCADIQEEANKGNFSRIFDASGYGGHKSLTVAQNLFIKHGYSTRLFGWSLVISWGRNFEQE